MCAGRTCSVWLNHVHVRRPHLLEAKRLLAAHLESIPGEMVQPHPGRPKQVPACSRPPVRPPTPPEARPLAEGCAPAVPSLWGSGLEWPSPRRGLREAAASLWGLPSVADPTAFGHVGRGRMRSSPRSRSGCRPLRRRPSLRARRDYGTLYVPTGLSSSVVTCCTLDSNKLKMWRPQPESFLYKGLFHDWCGRDCSLW